MNEQHNEPQNPWTTIWFDPRGTIRYLLETNPMHSFYLLIALGGIGNLFSSASGYGMADMLPVHQVIFSSLLVGPFAAFVSVYLWSWLLGISTKLFGGHAEKQQIRTAFVWSMAPVAYTLPLWGIRYILFRDELFTTERPFIEAHEFLKTLFGFFEGIDVIISLFSFYILINAIAEVSGLSFWRSIGSIGVILLLLIIPALLLVPFLTM